MIIKYCHNAYISSTVEHVVLGNLPIAGLTAKLHSIDQVQRVVVSANRNVVTEELVDLLDNTSLISTSELLDVIGAANIGEV